MSTTSAEIVLSRGLIDTDGSRHRRTVLVAPDGRLELVLADSSVGSMGPHEVNQLLADCIRRIGGYTDVTPEHAAALSRGDRSRLALWLRAMLAGDALVLTIRCPSPSCGEKADLPLRTAELVGEPGTPQPEFRQVLTADGTFWLRPPTGADDEACAAAAPDVAGQAEFLWGRLVHPSDGDGSGPPEPGSEPIGRGGWLALEASSQQALAAELAAGDGLLDLSFVSPCPRCRTWIEVELDPVDLLVRSVRSSERRLLAEVHSLAFHYGWSEAEILGLPRPRRLAYLELLRHQIEGRPLLDAWS